MWQFSATGQYTNQSAYEALFIGATSFGPWKQIWKSWAPGKCKFFLWTAALDRIWTADRFARKGLPHQQHVLFVIRLRNMLTTCWSHAFSLGKFGSLFCKLTTCKPWLHKLTFLSLSGGWQLALVWMVWLKKDLTPFLFLDVWTIWKHRNRCVFDGITPDVSRFVSAINEDLHQWSFAGGRGVSVSSP